MEIEKLFDKDVDGIADNIFGVVNNSVNDVREMQKRKVAENVQIVIDALKKIESDIRDRMENVGGSLEKRILSIKDGRNGIDGKDGRNGKDGKQGKDGRPGRDGKDGKNGLDGQNGEDGVSVVNAHIDFDGSLIITLSSGKEINVGEVVASDIAEKIKVITNGGGTSQSVLDALDSLQAQINALDEFLDYKGTWNASTNSPTLVSSTGTKGDYYVVSVAGSTTLDGESNWGVGDWVVFNNSTWQKVDGGSTGNLTTAIITTSLTLSYGTASTALALDASKNVVSVTNTGSGNNVLATSPTLVTPILGTPQSATLTNATGLPISSGVSGLGTNVATALGVNVGTAGAFVVNGGALGTPSSGTVTNLTGTASININGTVGATTPTTGAFTTLTTSSTVTLNGGTANGVLYLNGSNVATSGSALTFDGTNLGVGLASPGCKVDILAASNTSLAPTLRVYSNNLAVNTAISYDGIQGSGDFYLGSTSNSPVIFKQNNTEGMRLTSTGLGIGTSSPTSRLHVSNSTASTNAIAQFTNGTTGTGAGNGLYVGIDTSNEATVYNFYNSALKFGTNGTERMRIDSSGNVGIGTSSAVYGGQLNVKASSVTALSLQNSNFSAATSGTQFNTFFGSATGSTYAAMQVNSGGGLSYGDLVLQPNGGNLGLGVTPSTSNAGRTFELNTVGNQVRCNGINDMNVESNTYYNSGFKYASTGTATRYAQSSGQHQWHTAASGTAGNAISFTQAMTLDASGNLLVGPNAGDVTGTQQGFAVAPGSGFCVSSHAGGTASGTSYIYFNYNAGTIGSITQNGTTAVAYNTSSDYRLKDNQQPLTGSGAFIDALKPKIWDWKADGSKGVGFIAHEVQEVSPNSVVGEKDAVDADGKPVYQAMEYGSAEFIANIVAELQSLRARVAQLEQGA